MILKDKRNVKSKKITENSIFFLTNRLLFGNIGGELGGNMDKIVDLQNLKSKDYISLSMDLKELLFTYWNLLKKSNNVSIDNL